MSPSSVAPQAGAAPDVRRRSSVAEFVLETRVENLPPDVREQLAYVLLDLAACAVAGRPAPVAQIAADYATAALPGDDAAALLDGRRLSASGAAFANGALANALDLDDGHRLAKGHPGAVVIPAALAAAQATDANVAELCTAIAVGYEIAVRAAIDLHAREAVHHASGAWGALGAAAAAGRLLGLGPRELCQALALAEFNAPIAPIMRTVAHPAMAKDATAWGALTGVAAAQLAAHGFTGTAPAFLDTPPDDLGQRWHLLELYVKEHPCCRWSQGAIRAALALRWRHRLDAGQIAGVTIRTFDAAARLARRPPTSTEDAQYSLVWPVARALAHGELDVPAVLGAWGDPLVADLVARTVVISDPALTRRFPARRVTDITLELTDGAIVTSGEVEARGEPGDPAWREIVEHKARRHLDHGAPPGAAADPDARVGRHGADELLAVLAHGAAALPDAA